MCILQKLVARLFSDKWEVLYNEMLQTWSTEIKSSASCSESSKKNNQTNTIFLVDEAEVEDNVTQQLSDPDNDNSNLICAAEFASESINILSKSVEQNQLSTSTGATT